MYQNIDFFQFQKRFATEDRCIKYLFKQRWADQFKCSKCGSHEAYFIKSRQLYQCKKCKHQISVTAGTVFHKTRTPLRKWFWMIYILSQSKHSYSVAGLQKLLKIKAYRTAWLMAHKIRKAMSDRDAKYKLAGIIEMDDSYFGTFRATGKRGRGADKKTKVVVCAQVNENNRPIFASMTPVEKVDGDNIKDVAQQNIDTCSTVKTDGWPAYNVIKEQNMIHEKHVIGDPKNAPIILPWVHTLISNCKGNLRGTHHGISKKHLSYYLAEFCYRFNRRFNPEQLFDRLVTACFSTNTITLAELTT